VGPVLNKYIVLRPGDDLKKLDDFKPFKCVILISQTVEKEWRRKVSEWLVSSGCLFMMAWGHECSAWDDSVDTANLEQFNFKKIPDKKLILTTWHSDECLEEVFHFAKLAARHPIIELKNFLILDIGKSGPKEHLEGILGRV
jgi:hypothetical protein